MYEFARRQSNIVKSGTEGPRNEGIHTNFNILAREYLTLNNAVICTTKILFCEANSNLNKS